MNIGHKKAFLVFLTTRLLTPRLLITLIACCSGVFSTLVQAHPNFDPQYDYLYNDQYEYNEQNKYQSVDRRTLPKAAHSPFTAYPEMIYDWELADNHKNYRKHDRKRFDELTPAQREKIKKRRETFKSLPPEERERIYRAREEFHNMPQEKRQRLKEKWRNMTPEERERAHKRRDKSRKN